MDGHSGLSGSESSTTPAADLATLSGPSALSDIGELASNDKLESVGARENKEDDYAEEEDDPEEEDDADEYDPDEEDKEEKDADEDEDEVEEDQGIDTISSSARIDSSSAACNPMSMNLPEQETSMDKIESSGVGMSGNGGEDDRRASAGASGQNSGASASLLPGIVVEEDADEDEVEEEQGIDTIFTSARIDPSSAACNPMSMNLPEQETSMDKIESSGVGMSGNGGEDDRRASASASGQNSGASVSLLPEIVVEEDTGKGIFAENFHRTGAYIAREEALQREEDAGLLKFICCTNDGIDEHMIWLIGLKNIFAKRIPNISKKYTLRFLMDRIHKSMMVIRDNQVFGGITYRPFISQKFGEIALLAVAGDEQTKGYGTRLMNHLKQHARDVDGLTHFLTYADNDAIGYFMKQGFTKEISLEKERWQGYLKIYEGVTLMECKIDTKLPYTDLATMIRLQRQAIDEKVRELSKCCIVYPGIDLQKNDIGIPGKPIEVEDIPGLREAGWTPDQWGDSRFMTANVTDRVAYRQQLNNFMHSLLKMMNDHHDAWPFRNPADPYDAPDYYQVITDPINLKLMSKRLESEKYYLTLDMFVADAKRMFANARIFNPPDSIYYECSLRVEKSLEKMVQALLKTANKS